jgi:hypothetical protein
MLRTRSTSSANPGTPPVVSDNPATGVTQEVKDRFKSEAQANIRSLVKLKVGAESAESVETQAEVRLIAVQDAAKLARDSRPTPIAFRMRRIGKPPILACSSPW